MTDYHPLIARAVDGLEKSTGEARRALYERARTALVTQLRSVDPPLSESDITRERLALEDAIRKVEADAARKSRAELSAPRQAAAPPPPRRPTPPADAGRAAPPRPPFGDTEAEAPQRTAPSTARERLLSARPPQPLAQEGIKGFRDVVSEVHDLGSATAKAAQSARETRDSYGSVSPGSMSPGYMSPGSTSPGSMSPAAEEAASAHDYESELDTEDFAAEDYEPRHERGRMLRHEAEDEEAAPPFTRRTGQAPEDEHQRPPRSYRGLVMVLVALLILAGVAATISWQWPHIAGLYRSVAQVGQVGSKQPSQTARDTAAQPKFPGRVPQEQSAGQAPGAAAPGSQAVPAVAQRVVLYEEDPNDPQGKRYAGSAIWRTETVSPGPGLAPELAIRADVEIPERRLAMTWSLRRNTDQALPASHTIEIMFTLPADFPGGGVANVPGILMKQSEQARGTPLAGLAVKVTNGFFLIGLSAAEADVQRNVQLLKERPWFDIPVVYTNGGRAILAMEKGPPGDRAFADAFAAWEKK
jgi:hypothetical protein